MDQVIKDPYNTSYIFDDCILSEIRLKLKEDGETDVFNFMTNGKIIKLSNDSLALADNKVYSAYSSNKCPNPVNSLMVKYSTKSLDSYNIIKPGPVGNIIRG